MKIHSTYSPLSTLQIILYSNSNQNYDFLISDFLLRILNTHSNTYTYSKLLAENLIYEYSKELPCIIFRPSVGM